MGGLIILTNTRTLLRSDWFGVTGTPLNVAYVVIVAAWISAVAWSLRAHRAEREAQVVRADEPTG